MNKLDSCRHDFIPVLVFRDHQNSIKWCTKCGTLKVDVKEGETYLEKSQIIFHLT